MTGIKSLKMALNVIAALFLSLLICNTALCDIGDYDGLYSGTFSSDAGATDNFTGYWIARVEGESAFFLFWVEEGNLFEDIMDVSKDLEVSAEGNVSGSLNASGIAITAKINDVSGDDSGIYIFEEGMWDYQSGSEHWFGPLEGGQQNVSLSTEYTGCYAGDYVYDIYPEGSGTPGDEGSVTNVLVNPDGYCSGTAVSTPTGDTDSFEGFVAKIDDTIGLRLLGITETGSGIIGEYDVSGAPILINGRLNNPGIAGGLDGTFSVTKGECSSFTFSCFISTLW